jgi:hypothetical protein
MTMNSLASNVHVLRDLDRTAPQPASPATLTSVIASLFSASGRDRLAMQSVSDASAAYAWGL